MTTNEFSSFYHQTFGTLIPGLLNNDARGICQRYTHERIAQAFKVTAEKGGKTFDYFRKVLENKKEEQKGTDWKEVWSDYDPSAA